MKTLLQAAACWRMSILLVLRVSFTLFNLQGARRSRGWTFSLPYSKLFVKNFFQVFQLYSLLSLSRAVWRELDYINTTVSLCQALFSTFFEIPFKFRWKTALLNRRSINIPNRNPNVNTFFHFFRLSFFTLFFVPISLENHCCGTTKTMLSFIYYIM